MNFLKLLLLFWARSISNSISRQIFLKSLMLEMVGFSCKPAYIQVSISGSTGKISTGQCLVIFFNAELFSSILSASSLSVSYSMKKAFISPVSTTYSIKLLNIRYLPYVTINLASMFMFNF